MSPVSNTDDPTSLSITELRGRRAPALATEGKKGAVTVLGKVLWRQIPEAVGLLLGSVGIILYYIIKCNSEPNV